MKARHNLDLPEKKIRTGLAQLQKAGIGPDRWLRMLNASPAVMQELERTWPGGEDAGDNGYLMLPTTRWGIVYDAATVNRVLGITAQCRKPAPVPGWDEVVVYYGGWTIEELCSCREGKRWIYIQDEDDRMSVDQFRSDPGYYRTLIPVKGTDDRDWFHQTRILDDGWEPIPTAIGVTVMLVHRAVTGRNLLSEEHFGRGYFFRCAEELTRKFRPTVEFCSNRLRIWSKNDDQAESFGWLGACKKVS